MAKEEVTTTQETSAPEEVIIRTRPATYSRATHPKTDTKTVVIAVGASVVLFLIGLILGYLLGHQSSDRDGYNNSMMNGSSRSYLDRTQ